jgi:hypothetical protein
MDANRDLINRQRPAGDESSRDRRQSMVKERGIYSFMKPLKWFQAAQQTDLIFRTELPTVN